MPTWSKVLGKRTVCGEQALRMPCGLQPLHAPFPLPWWLVRVLGTVIERAVLAVFHPRQHLTLGGSIAFACIRDAHSGDVLTSLEEFAGKLSGWNGFC